jgi:SGNH hydrolase-like domain, acetyltransferase AlgX
MPRRLNVLTVLAFCAFLVLPLRLLAGLGAVAPYGQKDFTPFPEPKKLLHGSPKARKELSSALFERSAATVFAIRTHNAALYRVTGTIDTDTIVSGEGEWLFFKQQFWEGKCIPDEMIAITLRTIDTMGALAAASGLPVLFTVSPDTVTIHPEKLGRRARAYAGCRMQNGNRWRQLASRFAPDLLDHATAILKPENPKVAYYFATDTHWNSRGAALAVSQLASTLEGKEPSAPALYAGIPTENTTDMRNNMLLLGGPELDLEVTAFPTPRQDVQPVMFLIDSFYGRARGELEKAFPGSKFYTLEDNEEEYSDELQGHTGQVVVNSVERSLFLRFSDWNGALARAILKRNMMVARRCAYTQPVNVDTGVTLENLKHTGPSSFLAETADPNLIVPIPEHADCLRVTVEIPKPAVFEMYLPTIDGRDDPDQFADGRTVALDLPAGKSVLTFMLPNGRVGKELRIDPVNAPWPFKLEDVAFGAFNEH